MCFYEYRILKQNLTEYFDNSIRKKERKKKACDALQGLSSFLKEKNDYKRQNAMAPLEKKETIE